MRSTAPGAGMSWLRAPSPEAVARAFADVSGAAGVGVVLALVGLVFLWREHERPLAVWLGAWAAAPFALALLTTAVTPVFLDRYLIVAAPGFAFLAGVAITRAGRRLGPLLAGVAALACLVALLHWYSARPDGNWRGEDWRGAVAALRAESGSSAVVVSPWWAYLAPMYYGAEPAQMSAAASTWVLTWSESGHALSGLERRQLGLAGQRLVERQDFGRRVSLQHWVRRE
jgi:mannosyltransferase